MIGKIAELCKYLKDNLSNSIRCLLDSMIESGELDTLITETILSEVSITLKITDSFIVPELFDNEGDDAIAINKAINTGKKVILGNKEYHIKTPIIISKPTTIEGCGIGKTTLNVEAQTNVFEINPELRGIEGKGFNIGCFKIKGNNYANIGFHYNNNGKVENYIARWLIHDVEITGCVQAVEFTNQEVADGYFIGGFERIYSGCPLNFYRAGDSWFIRDSQFFDNGKVTIHSISTGARCFVFENNNYTAQGFEFNGNGLIFEKNQMEPSTLPAVRIRGYNCVIKNSAINSHGTDSLSYLIDINNDLGVDNQGAINTIEGGILVCPKNSNKIIRANDKVTISNTGFYENAGAIIKNKGEYIKGLLVDYNTEWSFRGENGSEIVEQYTEYKDGYLHVSLRANASLTDSYDGTPLLSIDNGHNLTSNQYISFFGEYAPGSVLTRSPSWARISTPKTVNTSAPYSQAQTLTQFVIAGLIKCEL